MRVRIDRGVDAMHLALTDQLEARRTEPAEGVVVAYDGAGRIVGIELRGIDPAAWHEFSVELAGLADRPAGRASHPASPRPATPPPPPAYAGPLTWEPEAEAAMLEVPFFSRGKQRLAASALARKRGQDRVTLEIVRAAGG